MEMGTPVTLRHRTRSRVVSRKGSEDVQPRSQRTVQSPLAKMSPSTRLSGTPRTACTGLRDQSCVRSLNASPIINQDSKEYSKKSTQAAASSPPVCGRIVEVFQSLPFSPVFDLLEEIGEGTFSTVYLAARRGGSARIALKHLVPTSKPSRIAMEIECMEKAGTHPNVVELLGVWRLDGDVILAMPYMPHVRFSDLLHDMDLPELQQYLANLFSALAHIHSLGIVHRDVKPSNFLYDRVGRRYALVDFGLAQYQKDLISSAAQPAAAGRGNKRKADEDVEIVAACAPNKKGRSILGEVDLRLNCVNTSPQTSRLLRDLKPVRRSPRKLLSPSKEDRRPTLAEIAQEQKLLSASTTARLKMVPLPTSSPTKASAVLLRKSPRKQHQLSTSLPPLTRPAAGFSKLTITGNAILGSAAAATPQSSIAATPTMTTCHSNNSSSAASTPVGLIRTPSFTILEPASYAAVAASQLSALTTDTCQGGHLGRTPLLRASVTSTCSSAALPPVAPASTILPPTSRQHISSRPAMTSNAGNGASPAAMPCACLSRPRVCAVCLDLPHMHAARAGTPGFRPPEVLLKHAGQTTAIDLWAVGVMLLCILSRSYPFFRAPDDLTALAELTVIFGSQAVKEAAQRYGRRLLTSHESQPKNLGFLCKILSQRLRYREEEDGGGDSDSSQDTAKMQSMPAPHLVTEESESLLTLLLRLDHTHRITATEALDHPFLRDVKYYT